MMEFGNISFIANAEEEQPFTGLLRFQSLQQEMEFIKDIKNNDPGLLEKTMELNELVFGAAENNEAEELERLIDSRGNLDLLCWHTARAFNLALTENHLDVLRVFVKKGLDLSHVIFKGTLPKFALTWTNDETYRIVLDVLLEGGLHIDDMESEAYNTALHFACLKLDKDLVTLLLQKKANVNSINNYKQVPLNLVENHDQEEAREIAEILRRHGAMSRWNDY